VNIVKTSTVTHTDSSTNRDVMWNLEDASTDRVGLQVPSAECCWLPGKHQVEQLLLSRNLASMPMLWHRDKCELYCNWLIVTRRSRGT